MSARGIRAGAGRWWPLLVVVAGMLGYLGWRQFHHDRIEELFEFLPADHGLYAYLGLGTVRSSLLLAGGETVARVLDEKGRLGEHLTALSDAGAEDLALSVGVHEIRAVARGAFDEAEVRTYIERQGLICDGALGDFTCLTESSQARTEVHLRGGSRIEIIDRSSDSNTAPGPSQATYLAAPARAGLRGGAVVWMAFQPDQLEAAMKEPPRGMMNLTLIARALREAAIAYAVLEPNLTSRSLDLKLSALASSPELAAKTLRVVEDTSDLAAAAIDLGSGEAGPNPWSQLFRTGTFARHGATAQAVWRIDPKKLPQMFPESR
ncbi:MAG: hypothetical protein O2968_15280 [Acidobacteria bacterium]|nr:hypothetical protein [Acidobacteriota bacterium]